ncbi:MAG: hypothetical protein M1368_10980 [Thaumarchaeota archaeon]|nr:hypothetical protein [Nitrososphaerota archaeon]
MKARMDRALFTQINTDSGLLTRLSFISHRFPESGEYHGIVLIGESVVARFKVTVSEERRVASQTSRSEKHASQSQQPDTEASKIEVDLRRLHVPRAEEKKERENQFSLQAGGTAVFFVSEGLGGYSVEMYKKGREGLRPKVFDSRELGEDDTLTVIPLRPGVYALTNVIDNARAELTVAYPEKMPRELPAMNVTCAKNRIEPDKIKVHPTQALVFRFSAPSRITTNLTKPEDRPRQYAPSRPRISISQEAKKAQLTTPTGKKVIRRLRVFPRSYAPA